MQCASFSAALVNPSKGSSSLLDLHYVNRSAPKRGRISNIDKQFLTVLTLATLMDGRRLPVIARTQLHRATS
jgi:hypothetical protein